MNIYNILQNYYYTGLNITQEYCDYSKEVKKERLSKISNYLDKYLDSYTKDNKKKGDIYLMIHIIGILTLILLYIFIPINKYSITAIIGLGLLQGLTNKYFGQNGCIVTRLERFYYDDKNWFGPVTFFILFLNKNPTRFNVDLSIGISSSIIVMYYIYRLYNRFKGNFFPFV